MHAAADGGLARVRVPGGRLTATQLREIARASASYGNGVIELTSRANIQVRGLGPDGGFAARMADAGLLPSATHERVRNVLASPLTGLDGPGGGGIADVTPLVEELDRRLCARPALAALPGRFMFALDDGRGDVAGFDADSGILPTGPDEAAVLLAGADSGLRVPLGGAVTVLLAAADAFLAEQAAQDVTVWRVSELHDGPARIATRLRAVLAPPSGAAGPGSGGAVPEPGPGRAGGTGEAGGGTGPVRPRAAAFGPVGVVPGGDGARVALGVAVPLGRLTAEQAEALADAAAGGEIRLTPWRGAVLPGLRKDQVAGTAARLVAAGLVVDPDSPWIGVTACTGRPGCARSLADVQADAALVIALSGAAGPSGSPGPPDPDGPAGSRGATSPGGTGGAAPVAGRAPGTGTLPVHWAGCGRRCGRPRGRVADVVATGDGYRVELDGTGRACAGIEETAAAVAAARGDL
ncbi:nitrite/sulfite reductase [Streptosporangium fragile]|uniref:Nitrite/sulfite reductase n=1 Tax=Streptosporangium fragile TaxID=46186 RepID=A0ABN3VYS0_9ACTN